MKPARPAFFAVRALKALCSVFVCFAICVLVFVILLLVWSLFPAPFAALPSASPVVLGAFFLASAASVFLWGRLYRKKK